MQLAAGVEACPQFLRKKEDEGEDAGEDDGEDEGEDGGEDGEEVEEGGERKSCIRTC
jgi:hypothetical protein